MDIRGLPRYNSFYNAVVKNESIVKIAYFLVQEKCDINFKNKNKVYFDVLFYTCGHFKLNIFYSKITFLWQMISRTQITLF